MSDTLLLILLGLSAFRATWFVTRDTFPPMRRLREFLLSKARSTGRVVSVDSDGHVDEDGEYEELRGGLSWAAELITCYWCVSVWLAAALTLAVDLVHGLPLPLLWFGGTAALAALLCYATDRLGGE